MCLKKFEVCRGNLIKKQIVFNCFFLFYCFIVFYNVFWAPGRGASFRKDCDAVQSVRGDGGGALKES